MYPLEEGVDKKSNMRKQVKSKPDKYQPVKLVENDRECTRTKVPVKNKFGRSRKSTEVENIDPLEGRLTAKQRARRWLKNKFMRDKKKSRLPEKKPRGLKIKRNVSRQVKMDANATECSRMEVPVFKKKYQTDPWFLENVGQSSNDHPMEGHKYYKGHENMCPLEERVAENPNTRKRVESKPENLGQSSKDQPMEGLKYYLGHENMCPLEERVAVKSNTRKRVESKPDKYQPVTQVENGRECTRSKVPVKNKFGRSRKSKEVENIYPFQDRVAVKQNARRWVKNKFKRVKNKLRRLKNNPKRVNGKPNREVENKHDVYQPRKLFASATECFRIGVSGKNNPSKREKRKGVESIEPSQNSVAGKRKMKKRVKLVRDMNIKQSITQGTNEFEQSNEVPPTKKHIKYVKGIKSVEPLQDRLTGKQNPRRTVKQEPGVDGPVTHEPINDTECTIDVVPVGDEEANVVMSSFQNQLFFEQSFYQMENEFGQSSDNAPAEKTERSDSSQRSDSGIEDILDDTEYKRWKTVPSPVSPMSTMSSQSESEDMDQKMPTERSCRSL